MVNIKEAVNNSAIVELQHYYLTMYRRDKKKKFVIHRKALSTQFSVGFRKD